MQSSNCECAYILTMKNLAFSVLVLLLLGCGRNPANPDEAAVVAMIQKAGGKVEFDGQDQNQRVIKVYLNSTAVQDADLAGFEKLSKLQNLFLGSTQISDIGVAHLQSCAELKTLALNSTRVTDEGLKSLIKLTNLRTLNLQETSITAAGSTRLRKNLPNLSIAR